MVKYLFLIYHAVLPINENITNSYYEDPIYTIHLDAFKKHLNLFQDVFRKESKYVPVLTFDDGHVSSYKYIFPLLEKNNIQAFFFPVCSLINKKGFLSSSMIQEMSQEKMIFGSHGMTHRYFPSLSDKELFFELDYSKKMLEDILGQSVNDLSCPGGRFDKRTIQLAKRLGYKSLYTSKPQIVKEGSFLKGRIPIKRDHSLKEIQRFLEGKIFKMEIKYSILKIAQNILGNYYEPLRNLIALRRFS